jgi:hypothetical protein
MLTAALDVRECTAELPDAAVGRAREPRPTLVERGRGRPGRRLNLRQPLGDLPAVARDGGAAAARAAQATHQPCTQQTLLPRKPRRKHQDDFIKRKMKSPNLPKVRRADKFFFFFFFFCFFLFSFLSVHSLPYPLHRPQQKKCTTHENNEQSGRSFTDEKKISNSDSHGEGKNEKRRKYKIIFQSRFFFFPPIRASHHSDDESSTKLAPHRLCTQFSPIDRLKFDGNKDLERAPSPFVGN